MMLNKGWTSWLNVLLPYRAPCLICSGPILTNAPYHNNVHWLSKLKLERQLCGQCIKEIAWIDKVMCARCGRSERCPDCNRRETLALWFNRSAVRYNEQMKQWLHRYKFQGDERLAGILGVMLMPAMEQVSLQLIKHYGLEAAWRSSRKLPAAWLQRSSEYHWDAVAAVPLSEQRYRERGFNQAERLANVISKVYSIPYYSLLYRTHHSTIRHSHQGRQARVMESKEQYSCQIDCWHRWFKEKRDMITNKEKLHILLVDDVYTTGSTLNACAEALIKISPLPLVVASVTWARS